VQPLALLGAHALGDLGVAGELVEHERDGRGRRVVAREHQRHHLVAHLSVGERAAVLVACVQQQAEHVLPALPRRAPARDLRVHDPVELLRRAPQPGPRGERAAQEARGVFGGVKGQRLLEQCRGVRAPGGLLVWVQAEQRPHRDPHRQAARPRVQVHAPPRRHLLQRALGLLDHHPRGGRDPLAVERGQHDLARAAVELAVDRQQPVAQ
jgi:hypothetical protein